MLPMWPRGHNTDENVQESNRLNVFIVANDSLRISISVNTYHKSYDTLQIVC